MPRIPFDDMPDHARLWVFATDRPLGGSDQETLLEVADGFLDGWAAHGAPLTCARELAHDRFLFIAVDEQAAGVSGCSIDALVRSLKTLEQQLDLALIDHSPVSYRHNGSIRRVSRGEFSELVSRRAVTLETTVFDNTIATVGELRSGKWEVSAGDAWHGRAFFEIAP
jgi:hypothetical protein